jgi:hypothetical protein
MTSTLTTANDTADILAGMFTENTGRHMLDSGGAYGRNWEHNQGRTTADFLNAPHGTFDQYCGPTLSTFHFLNDRLDFDPELQAEFDAFSEAEDDWGLPAMEGFATAAGWSFLTVNTYNHESALDQVIQYTQCSTEGEDACYYGDVVILQVHGGCDVRGGYTDPKVFRVTGDGEVGLLDDADVNIWCDGSTVTAPQVETLPAFDDTPPVEIRHEWYSDDAGYHWYGHEGYGDRNETRDYSLSYGSTDPEIQFDDDGNALCPCCATPTPLHVSGRYA